MIMTAPGYLSILDIEVQVLTSTACELRITNIEIITDLGVTVTEFERLVYRRFGARFSHCPPLMTRYSGFQSSNLQGFRVIVYEMGALKTILADIADTWLSIFSPQYIKELEDLFEQEGF